MPVSARSIGAGGGLGSPLRDFKGRVDAIAEVDSRFTDNNNVAKKNNVISFSELEVFESDSPYAFPVAQITIAQSDAPASRWGVFGLSALKFLADNEDIPDLKGRVVHVKADPDQMIYDMTTKAPKPTLAYIVVGVEGAVAVSSNGHSKAAVPAGGASAADEALKMLDGKTEEQFKQEVLTSATVRQDMGLVTKIISGEWVAGLGSQATRGADGVYHVAMVK